MEVTIKGEAKEIAALVFAVQERQGDSKTQHNSGPDAKERAVAESCRRILREEFAARISHQPKQQLDENRVKQIIEETEKERFQNGREKQSKIIEA